MNQEENIQTLNYTPFSYLVSEYFPLGLLHFILFFHIGQYFLVCIIMVSLSCGIAVITMHIHSLGFALHKKSIPNWIRFLVINVLAPLLLNRQSSKLSNQVWLGEPYQWRSQRGTPGTSPPEMGKNCCRKMMSFPKALFLATTFP